MSHLQKFSKSVMTSEKDQIQDGTNKDLKNMSVRFFVMTIEKCKGVFSFWFDIKFYLLRGYFLNDRKSNLHPR